jgi:HK97 gp10 family phage protein
MIKFKITGEAEMAKALQGLPSKIKKDVAFAAMVAAVQPTVLAAKALAPVGETGELKKSIGFVVRQYRRGDVTYGIIGARRGFGTKKTDPAKYAHLVEFGHAIAVGGKLFRGVNPFKNVKATGVLAGFVAPRPFLRPAWEATKTEVIAILSRVLGQGIEAAVAKQSKSIAKRNARMLMNTNA